MFLSPPLTMNACFALELTSMKTTNTIRKELGTELRCFGLWSSREDRQRSHKYVNIENT